MIEGHSHSKNIYDIEQKNCKGKQYQNNLHILKEKIENMNEQIGISAKNFKKKGTNRNPRNKNIISKKENINQWE